MNETHIEQIVKAAPPVTVSGLTLFGITVPEWIQLFTVIYVIFMAVDKGFVLYLRYRDRNKPNDYPKE